MLSSSYAARSSDPGPPSEDGGPVLIMPTSSSSSGLLEDGSFSYQSSGVRLERRDIPVSSMRERQMTAVPSPLRLEIMAPSNQAPVPSSSSSSSTSFSQSQDFDHSKFILSIDGGGIRGLIPAMVLDAIEMRLAEEFGADIRIADLFNVMAGTSTGSIISLALSVADPINKYRPKYRARDLVNLYQEEGRGIFKQGWWRSLIFVFSSKHSADYLEGLLKTYFGESRLSEATQGIHVLAPAYSLDRNEPVFFDSHDIWQRRTQGENPYDPLMREVVRSSGAAPTYLPAATVEGESLVDGGVFMNDPALAAYAKAEHAYKGHGKKLNLLSLGTGEAEKKLSVKKLRKGGILAWLGIIHEVAMDGAVHSSRTLLEWLQQAEKVTYHRLQSSLEEEVLDKVNEKTLGALKVAASNLIASPEFDRVYEQLSNSWRARNDVLVDKLSHLNATPEADLSEAFFKRTDWTRLYNHLRDTSFHLQSLNLRRTAIMGDESNLNSIKYLCEALEENETVTDLDLSENGIGLGVMYIGELLFHNKTLQKLKLRSNGIDSSASLELRSLVRKEGTTNPTSLISLDLGDNRIDYSGYKSLIWGFTLPEAPQSLLTYIGLNKNNISLEGEWPDEDQECFVKMSKLPLKPGFLDLRYNSLPATIIDGIILTQ